MQNDADAHDVEGTKQEVMKHVSTDICGLRVGDDDGPLLHISGSCSWPATHRYQAYYCPSHSKAQAIVPAAEHPVGSTPHAMHANCYLSILHTACRYMSTRMSAGMPVLRTIL